MQVNGVSLNTAKNKWQARIRAYGRSLHLGYSSDWFEAVCMRKSAENEFPKAPNIRRRLKSKQYPLKDCPYCGKTISRISRKGKILKKGHYDQKKTCGAYACIKAAQTITPARAVFKPVSAMDYFLINRI